MKRSLAVLFLVLLVSGLSAATVSAGSIAFSGTFDAGDSTMPVVFISTPNCTGQGASPVRYDAFPFSVTATGAYNFIAASTGAGTEASIYIMNSGFNPAAAFPNCIAASNSGAPTTLSNVNLTAGTQYFLVIFDDTFGQTVPGYNFSANGVGDFNFGFPGQQQVCLNPLPAGSFVYTVPAGAPTFYDAKLDTQLSWNLPAGTWWISEFKGDFAKVWIACQAQPVYIPANAVQR